MGATCDRMAAKIDKRIKEEDARMAAEQQNEEEKNRAEWAATRNAADLAAGRPGEKRKPEKGAEKEGPRGRKRKYANEDERKAARKEAYQKHAAAKKAKKAADAQARYALVAVDGPACPMDVSDDEVEEGGDDYDDDQDRSGAAGSALVAIGSPVKQHVSDDEFGRSDGQDADEHSGGERSR